MKRTIEIILLILTGVSVVLLVIQPANGFVADFAIGYLSAYLFYIIVDMAPYYVRISQAKRIFAKQTYDLLEHIYRLVSITLHVSGIEKPLDQIKTTKDLSALDGRVIPASFGEYEIRNYHRNRRKSGEPSRAYSYPKSVAEYLSSIKDRVESIRTASPLFDADYRFAKTLASLDSNPLIRFYGAKSDNPHPLFVSNETSTYFLQLIQDYYALRKLGYHKSYANHDWKITFHDTDNTKKPSAHAKEFLEVLSDYR